MTNKLLLEVRNTEHLASVGIVGYDIYKGDVWVASVHGNTMDGEPDTRYTEAAALARQIVHCVNIHDELVGALEAIERLFCESDTQNFTAEDMADIAHAILTKARGEG